MKISLVLWFVLLQDAFIGFGGNVVRDKVKDKAKWFVTHFSELIDTLQTPSKEAS
jgi:hypothetical protein